MSKDKRFEALGAPLQNFEGPSAPPIGNYPPFGSVPPEYFQHNPVGPPPSYDATMYRDLSKGCEIPTGPAPPYSFNPPLPAQYFANAPAGPNQNQMYYNPQPTASVGPPATAVFAAGARFNGQGGGSMNIPPPPPGYAPNAAQLAAMQGRPVEVQKEKNNFFSGGKGSGYTFW